MSLDPQAIKDAMQGRWHGFYETYTPLKRVGAELRGPCPFHNGEDPNFAVHPETGDWYCHSQCKDGGDAFTFLMRREGLTFPQALRRLADCAGLSPAYQDPPARPREGTRRKGTMFQNKPPLGPIAETYDYTDEHRALLFQTTRHRPKAFRQRRPDPDVSGRWLPNLQGVEPVLYRLPQVAAAVRAGQTVYVTEGEKDADALAALGLCATTNPMGAGKWRDAYTQALCQADVVILPDNDKPGRDHAQAVANALHGKASSVRVVELPGLPDKGDVSDWLHAGGTRQSLETRVAAAADFTAAPDPPDDAEDDAKAKGRQSSAQLLVEIGMRAELFHDDRDANFARFPVGDHRQVWPLRSRAFREWLSREYYIAHGKPPGGQALEDALRVLDGGARYDGPLRPLALRVAAHDGGVLLDLADAHWGTIHVTADGWQAPAEPPCLFRRYAVSAPHAPPRRGGTLDALRPFLNVRDEDAWRQLVAWLIAALLPEIAHPVLVVHGEQGSAKSTLMRLLSLLVDPSRTPLRSEPRDLGEWVQAADHSWLTVLDNVSQLPPWLSDAICRAVTGEGFVKRQLYTDGEDIIVSYRRVIALTGIEVVAQRADLLDRSILLALEPIPPDRRRSETDVLREFEALRPVLLGALLDTLAGVLRELPRVSLPSPPRMADFARVGLAVEAVLGWPPGSFLDAYGGNIKEQHEEALSSSAVGDALRGFMAARPVWEGTAKELLDTLNAHVGETAARRREWPKTPKALGGQVRRIAPNLRATGLEVAFTTPHGKRLITLSRTAGGGTVPSVPTSDTFTTYPPAGTQTPPSGTQTDTRSSAPSSERNGGNGGNANLAAPSGRDRIIEVVL